MAYFWAMLPEPVWIKKAMLITSGLICGLSYSVAQTDSILQLKEIEVTAQRIDLTSIGKHTEKLDSQTLFREQHGSVASLFSKNTPFFIRSYGNGTLATLGIRGGSAAHTQIIWNGIPIRNPMVGLVDLALIPVTFVDEASIHYGGHGAAFGSGAVGGLISISNTDITSASLRAHAGIGSWNSRFGSLHVNYGIKKLRLSSRLFAENADNDFKYRLAKGSAIKEQVHHKLINRGWLQEAYLPINEKHSVTARLWYQFADRQVPPTSTQTNSKAAQQDEALRCAFQWNHTMSQSQWQVKVGWLNERIDFQDSLILLYAHNRFTTWLAEGSISKALSDEIFLMGGIYTEIVKGRSGNYGEAHTRDQTAMYTSLRWHPGIFLVRLQAREEVTGGSWSPLLVDLAGELNFLKGVALKSSVSRNYRTPTLNDLYWRPGGNPALKPEDGWTYEAGVSYNASTTHIDFQSSFTAYTRTINDWIMWMPPVKDGNNFWAPLNIARVRSQGFESRAAISWENESLKASLNAGADLTWSTFQEPLDEFRIDIGDQLFYVPVENFFTGFDFHYRNVSFHYDHHYFGQSPGINEPVQAYSLGNAGFSFEFNSLPVHWTFYVEAENVWDTPYRIIERRPMPGRSFRGGLKILFK